MQPYAELVKELREQGLEKLQLYYSLYPGKVADNNDPQKQGRLKVRVEQITDNQVIDNWAYPVAALGNGGAFLSLPKVGELVWVAFEQGDVRYPLWLGSWWKKEGVPTAAQADYPLLHIWQTPEGNSIVMNDKTKEMAMVDSFGNEVRLSNGRFAATVKQGGTLVVNGQIVELNGSAEFAVLGETLKTQINLLDAKFDAICAALSAWQQAVAGAPIADIALLRAALAIPLQLQGADFANILSTKVKLG